MTEKIYVVKEEDGNLLYDDSLLFTNPATIKVIGHDLRRRILKLLVKKPRYAAEIARELKIHEQKIYYHIRHLVSSGLLIEVERKEIRGTIAKKYKASATNFSVSLFSRWRPLNNLISEQSKDIKKFFEPFIEEDHFTSKVIVGSPDPHGPFKARARDGHYAIELALFLGGLSSLSKDFSVNLDVDIDLKDEQKSLIIVGGPVTNLLTGKINEFLPARFSDKKPWGIVSKKSYTDDSCGIIARIPNPAKPSRSLLILAGVTSIGTKAAVLALTRHPKLVLSRFSDQKDFSAVVQGFDLDGDGRIDDIELLE